MEEAKRRVLEELANTWNSIPENSFSANDFLNKKLTVPKEEAKKAIESAWDAAVKRVSENKE